MSRNHRFVAAVCTALAATFVVTEVAAQVRLRPGTRAEIEARILGQGVRLPDEQGVWATSGSPDVFCPSGKFWRGRDRAPSDEGAFTVEDGRACVALASRKGDTCYAIEVNPEGAFFIRRDTASAKSIPLETTKPWGAAC